MVAKLGMYGPPLRRKRNYVAVQTTGASFAMTLGGGADYRYNEHISFRGQAEYVCTHFAGTRQNNDRIEVGIVYRWGAR